MKTPAELAQLRAAVLDGLILHPAVKSWMKAAGADGAVVAYKQFVAAYAPPVIRGMTVAQLAAELEQRSGKPWVIKPDRFWYTRTVEIVETPNCYLTSESKARKLLADMAERNRRWA